MAPLTDVPVYEETPHRRFDVKSPEDVGALRRSVSELAGRLPGVSSGDAALVATELGTNLVRHTHQGGYVLYRSAHGGIELLAVDQGPGMDRSVPLRGSRLSAGRQWQGGAGLGVGLAGVERYSTVFGLYSTAPGGTVVLARLLPAVPPPSRWRRGSVNVGFDGGGESGDRAAVEANGTLAALVVDGLGHGPEAADAARAAVAALATQRSGDPVDFVHRAHELMRGTRGGVLAFSLIDPVRNLLRHAGVGNITGLLIHGRSTEHLLGHDGTLGTKLPLVRVRVSEHSWQPGSTLVLATDGLRSGFDPLAYPNLLLHDPAVVAAVLHRDFARGTDDATVLVVQERSAPPA